MGRPKKLEMEKSEKKKGTRGRKNLFKNGKYMVYQFSMKEGKVAPLWNANPVVAESLEVCAKYFAGNCMTTNYVEQQFSTLKKLIDFKGKRTLKPGNLFYLLTLLLEMTRQSWSKQWIK